MRVYFLEQGEVKEGTLIGKYYGVGYDDEWDPYATYQVEEEDKSLHEHRKIYKTRESAEKASKVVILGNKKRAAEFALDEVRNALKYIENNNLIEQFEADINDIQERTKAMVGNNDKEEEK